MYNFNTTKILPYSAKQLYDLIIDIEQYPYFVPKCTFAKILTKSAQELTAKLTFNSGFISKSYTSKVNFVAYESIIANNLDGPLKNLCSQWFFCAKDAHLTELKFNIEYQFSSNLLNDLTTKLQITLVEKLTLSFIKRAEYLYGKSYD